MYNAEKGCREGGNEGSRQGFVKVDRFKEKERERRGWTKYRRRKEERKIESRVRNAKVKDFERTLHNGKLIKWRNDDESKGGDLMEILGKLAGKGFLKCMKNVSRIGWY